MLVNQQNFLETLTRFEKPGCYGLDTETTGLLESDRLFSIILSDHLGAYYFNFQEYTDTNLEFKLPRKWLAKFRPIFYEAASTWFMHNAKFDMRMLIKEGLTLRGNVHCTMALERIVKNNYFGAGYTLKACLKRIGDAKDDGVEKYIREHKLYEKVKIPGKKKISTNKFFWKVPLEVIHPYGEQDATGCRTLGMIQQYKLSEDLKVVADTEKELTKTCFKMERRGVKIDRSYVTKALEHETNQIDEAKRRFQEETGFEFHDSGKHFAKVFDHHGEKYPLTAKGNPSFKAEALDAMVTPVAKLIKTIRRHEKYARTYYSSFLYYADENDIVHANIRQSGTEHGRMSYADPNLQNVPKEDNDSDRVKPFIVRASFVPRADHCFFMVDYKAQEFRLLLDYVGEKELIKMIMGGHDPHQATADLVGVTRKEAKTINFGLLYGMGVDLLAKRLKCSVMDARDKRDQYFGKLPRVRGFLKKVAERGKTRGYVKNWTGRRCHLNDSDRAYILPNHIISGGCADMMKRAMNRIEKETHARMVIQVHDELVFEQSIGMFGEIEKAKEIMESVYTPRNGMFMECSVDHSFKSWGYPDKIEGMP